MGKLRTTLATGVWVMTAAVLSTGCGVRRSSLGDGGEPATAEDEDGGGGDAGKTLLDAGATNAGDGGDDKAITTPSSCGDYRIPVSNQIPEVLVVLDKSGSMRDDAGVDRWAPSVAAVDGVTHSLPDVHFGLLTFPGDCASITDPNEQVLCMARLAVEGATTSCQPGRVMVPVAQGSADAIRAALNAVSPLGATPTAAAIDTAAASLQALPVSTTSGNRSILLVTDGAPNCLLGVGGALATGDGANQTQPLAVPQTVEAIARAATAGVKTYVIGYDTAKDAALAGQLDQMAAAGGTGDTKHRPVEDQASLVAALGGLTRRTLLCDLRLGSPADPSRITVTFDGKVVARDDVNGWSLGADGVSISLRGLACDAVTAAPDKSGTVAVLCPAPSPPV